MRGINIEFPEDSVLHEINVKLVPVLICVITIRPITFEFIYSIRLATLKPNECSKFLSGDQPPVTLKTNLPTLVMETEVISETLVVNLTLSRLIARENFIGLEFVFYRPDLNKVLGGSQWPPSATRSSWPLSYWDRGLEYRCGALMFVFVFLCCVALCR
jgi:hypothetical protein